MPQKSPWYLDSVGGDRVLVTSWEMAYNCMDCGCLRAGSQNGSESMIHTARSLRETEALAEELAAGLQRGDFVALRGDLGAGKTAFARGLVRGLGSRAPVRSPSFTLMRIYADGRLPVYHFDAYRLAGPDELDALDFAEYAEGDGVCLVEWPERIEDALPPDRTEVRIEGSADEPRRITVERRKGTAWSS